MRTRFLVYMILGVAILAWGQQEPWDIARTTVGGKKVSIEYGRPTLNGRTLDSLMKQLPPDRVWRAGAGPITVLTTETDLLIGGKKIPAGNYSLYMYCPENGDYALLINRDIGEQPDGVLPKAAADRGNRPYPHFMNYTGEIADKEAARVPLKKTSALKTGVLIYSFEAAGKGALLTISWGGQAWSTEFQPAD